MKLKHSEIKETRLLLLDQQGGKCAICHLPCDVDQAVLDHDHKGGHIRAVLHRSCNAAEGKVINILRRFGVKDAQHFLRELISYHELHTTNQTGLIHPTFKTEAEKKERAKRRAKCRQVKLSKV